MLVISSLNKLWTYMISELPGCETPLAYQELRRAMVEFFDQTEVWEYTPAALDTTVDQTDFTPIITWDAWIKRVLWAKIDNNAVPMDTSYDGVAGMQVIDNRTIRLHANLAPTKASTGSTDLEDGFACKLVLVPIHGSSELPEAFLDRWAEAITAGAMASLMRMPKPYRWSNLPMSAFYAQKFDRAKQEAKNAKIKQQRGVNLRIKPRRWV